MPELATLLDARSCSGKAAPASQRAARAAFSGFCLISISVFLFCAENLAAREKDATQYGMGLIVNVPFPEAEVSQVVQDVIQNGIIRGTKEYNKDEYICGATQVSSTHVFPQWTEGGKVFYKVRLKAIDPRNFKDSGDVGTLAVRYVVQAQDENIPSSDRCPFRGGFPPYVSSVERLRRKRGI